MFRLYLIEQMGILCSMAPPGVGRTPNTPLSAGARRRDPAGDPLPVRKPSRAPATPIPGRGASKPRQPALLEYPFLRSSKTSHPPGHEQGLAPPSSAGPVGTGSASAPQPEATSQLDRIPIIRLQHRSEENPSGINRDGRNGTHEPRHPHSEGNNRTNSLTPPAHFKPTGTTAADVSNNGPGISTYRLLNH